MLLLSGFGAGLATAGAAYLAVSAIVGHRFTRPR